MYRHLIASTFLSCIALTVHADDMAAQTGNTPAVMPSSCKFVYPAESVEKHEEGIAIARVSINEKGEFTAAEIRKSTGFKLLDRAMMSAVSACRFIPAKQNGVAVASTLDVTQNFKIDAR